MRQVKSILSIDVLSQACPAPAKTISFQAPKTAK